MNRNTFFAVLCLFTVLPSMVFAQVRLDGKWEGSIRIAGQELNLSVDFKDDTSATIDIPQQGAYNLKLTNVKNAPPQIHFELPADPGHAVFDATFAKDLVKGTFTQAGFNGTFELAKGRTSPGTSGVELPPSQRVLLGPWNGEIAIMGRSLGILVAFEDGGGILTARIDIPAQNAKGLPLKEVRYNPPKVHFELPAGPGLATFDADLDRDSIKGVFRQAGITGAFTLARGEPSPQAPAAEEVFPYNQEEVIFYSDTLKFAGTLTLPPKSGRHPAVILITGSGAQNRDEELFGFKPFRMIADHFTRQGIAVLRYDDRGVGGSAGSTSQSTTSDFANDVLAAAKYLRGRQDINPLQIGLCGHSEGGIVGPLAASRDKSIAFIIMMAGTGYHGMEIILAQSALISRAEGVPEADIREANDVSRKALTALREGRSLDELHGEFLTLARKQLEKMKPKERETIVDPDEYLNTKIKTDMSRMQTPWFKFFIGYEPAPTLELLECPVLALFGELDLQVPAEMNKTAIEKALAGSKVPSYLTKIFPKANHLFLTAISGSPSEYSSLKKEFVPGFLDTMSEWILKQVTVVK